MTQNSFFLDKIDHDAMKVRTDAHLQNSTKNHTDFIKNYIQQF